MFLDTPSYRQSNSDAHRTRSTNISPPAMTWHMAFWLPQIINEDDANRPVFKPLENRSKIKEKLDAIILQIAKSLRQDVAHFPVNVLPRVGDTVIVFHDYIDAATLDVISEYRPSDRERDIKESDYRVVRIEFRWFDFWMTIRCELQTEYYTITVIAELPKAVAVSNKHLNAIDIFSRHLNPKPGRILPVSLENLFEYFWDDYNVFIRKLNDVKLLMEGAIFEEVYADFRGLITADVPPAASDNACSSRAWASSVVKRYKGALTHGDMYECTASYMLKRRALYLSALGPQIPSHPPPHRIPVTFVLCLADVGESGVAVDRWQLGRLVDRINFLGRVRLAALRNIKLLRSVGTELGRLDHIVKSARDAVEAYRDRKLPDEAAVKPMEQAHLRLNTISSAFLEHAENTAHSGILYRVERSRYYVNQFRRSVPLLRLSRLEGYQRYDQFIERRLGGTFDSIDRVGVRYERALNAMATIDQNYLAARSHQTGASVEEIQRYGELLLIGVLIPYYVISVINHLVHDSKALFSISIILMLVTTLGAIWRFSFSKEKPFRLESRFIRTLLIGLGLYGLVVLTALATRPVASGGDHKPPVVPPHPSATHP